MFGLGFQFEDHTPRLQTAAKKASFRTLGHAAFAIRRTAVQSIDYSAEPSAPGDPPNTERGHLRRAIRVAQDKEAEEAVIGPEFSKVGESAAAHEKGGEFKGEEFPERSFMAPALEVNLPRFHSDFESSIGE